MDNMQDNKNAVAISMLLKRMSKGEDPVKLRKEATKLVADVRPRDIAQAEQSLIDNGFSAQLVEHLSSAFLLMGIIDEQSTKLKLQLPDNHIVRKVMAEHELTRCYLAELEDIAVSLGEMETVSDVSSEFSRLTHIIEHLDAMEEHIEREEDIIFPFLKKHGWNSLCRASQSDHVYIRIAVSDLVKLIATFKTEKSSEFKVRLRSISKYLCPRMRDHLFQEDNILYPIALELIKDNKVWKKIKHICDEIGYCGVHV